MATAKACCTLQVGFYNNVLTNSLLCFVMSLCSRAHLSSSCSGSFTEAVSCNGKAEARWCVSGTPIVNSATDAYSLFNFIRYRQDFRV